MGIKLPLVAALAAALCSVAAAPAFGATAAVPTFGIAATSIVVGAGAVLGGGRKTRLAGFVVGVVDPASATFYDGVISISYPSDLLVVTGVGWFGSFTENITITVPNPPTIPPSFNGAQFVSQSVPSTLQLGQTASVSITLRNSGTTTWTAADNYRLGTQNPQDSTLWTGVTRLYLDSSESIAPGQQKTFTFNITISLSITPFSIMGSG